MTRSAGGGAAPKGRSRRNFAGTRPVMDDVARLAGVSKQTVSRVLNDNPAVRAETREAVLEAMRSLGYRPSRSARSLASGRTRMLGVISFDAARYGPASTLTAINTAAQDAGYLVSSIALDTADRDTVVQAVDRLSAEGADGVIAIAPQRRVGKALAEAHLDIPLVVMDNALGDDTPMVTADSRGGARLATEHLLDLGHRTVRHIAGPIGWTSAERRAASWRETLEKAGTEVPEPLVGDWSADSGYELAGGSPAIRTSPPSSPPTTRWRSARCAPSTRPAAGSRTTSASSATTTSPKRPICCPRSPPSAPTSRRSAPARCGCSWRGSTARRTRVRRSVRSRTRAWSPSSPPTSSCGAARVPHRPKLGEW